MALLQLADADPKVQLAAVEQLARLQCHRLAGQSQAPRGKAGLPAPGRQVRPTAPSSRIEEHIARVNFFGTIFHGVSLGSILLVVALGLGHHLSA